LRKKLVILSWGMYDLANTIFTINIITLYFALWVTVDKGGRDIYYSIAIAGSMILAAISEPIMGAVSDGLGKRMSFLISFTLLSIAFTAFMGLTSNLLVGLLFFVIANFGYQVGIVFYNSLLPEIASPKEIGRVSGFGISLGYVGTIVGLILVKPFVDVGGRQAAFIPTAIFFLLFSLPCFLFVKDKQFNLPASAYRRQAQGDFSCAGIKDALRRIKDTFVNRHKYPGLFTFLIANFICLDAVNTTIPFISIYAKKAVMMADGDIRFFLILSATFAIFGSFAFGYVTDKIGAKKAWAIVMVMWCIAFLFAAAILHKNVFWIVGPLSGVSIGSTWVATRALVTKLAPIEKRGEIFGLFGVTSKSASIIGPLTWGLITWLGEPLGVMRYRLAVLALLGFAVIGLVLLWKIPEPQR